MAFLPQPFQQDLKHSNQSSFISCRINKGRPFLCWNDARQKPCDKIGWKRIPLLNRNFSLQKSVPFGLGVLVKKIKIWNDCNTFLKFMIVDRRKKQHNMGTENSKSHKARSLTILVEFAILYTLLANQSAFAADALKTCSCLLKECRSELARCITDPSCAANIACLQSCNDRPDETECQLKCGDVFENAVVDQFNECAVSRKKCVPKKPDEGVFPVPDPSVLVKRFNMADFSGKWYISSGLNPSFDTFDCQVHQFSLSQDRLTGNLSWRISTPDGGFITRTGVQRFVQDRSQPGILYNHDNEYLHYQDDWYILSSKTENKPDDYIFVYYRGRNDAWDGYGGAVIYTRSPVLPSNIVPDLENAARKVGLDFKKFKRTDNTCAPEPPLFARLEKKVEEGEQAIAKEVEVIEEKIEENVEKVERTEMSLLEKLERGLKEIKKDEEYFLSNLNKEEKKLLGELKMEAEEVEKIFGKSLPIRKVR